VTGDLAEVPATAEPDAYARLIADLDASGCRYRLIEHPPEGRTEMVSALRGHPLAHAAKCLILLAKIGKKQACYVLAVVPGDARLDRSVALASRDYLRLAGPRIARIIAT
jgi:Ala-tRNA(Pro) deacylase